MDSSEVIKKKLKKLEEVFPGASKDIEKELIPLEGEKPKIKKDKD